MPRFITGVLVGVLIPFVAGALLIRAGLLPMRTNAAPLPFEKTLAGWAIHAEASKGDALTSPIAESPETLVAGSRVYLYHCAGCHGLPDHPITRFSTQMFPPIPQFFHHGVTDDPIGSIYWITRSGIRLSGMLAFEGILKDEELWQVAWFLKRTDKLPAEALKLLHP